MGIIHTTMHASSIRKLAEHLHLDKMTIQKLLKRDDLPTGVVYEIDGKRKYDVDKIKVFYQELMDEDEIEEEDDSPEMEKLRAVKRKREELKLKQELGELVELEAYREAEAKRYMIFKSTLYALVNTLPSRLENLTRDEMHEELLNVVDDLLNKLSSEVDAIDEIKEDENKTI